MELGQSRIKRDFIDLQTILKWFEYQSHDSFDSSRKVLQALDYGLVANDSVNCNDAESIGKPIQEKLDGVLMSEASIKRKEQAVTLANLKPHEKIGEEKVFIDPTFLLSRFLIMFQRYKEVDQFFGYKISPSPMSLFDKLQMMRKPSSHHYANILLKCSRNTGKWKNTVLRM